MSGSKFKETNGTKYSPTLKAKIFQQNGLGVEALALAVDAVLTRVAVGNIKRNTVPTGLRNALEVVIIYIRDEVAAKAKAPKPLAHFDSISRRVVGRPWVR